MRGKDQRPSRSASESRNNGRHNRRIRREAGEDDHRVRVENRRARRAARTTLKVARRAREARDATVEALKESQHEGLQNTDSEEELMEVDDDDSGSNSDPMVASEAPKPDGGTSRSEDDGLQSTNPNKELKDINAGKSDSDSEVMVMSEAPRPDPAASDMVLERATDAGAHLMSILHVKTSPGPHLARRSEDSTGFQLSHLRHQDAIHLPASLAHLRPTLSGEQSDLFSPTVWTASLDLEVHAFNQPAHQLATRLLSHPTCTLYFQNALFAARVVSTMIGADGAMTDIQRIPNILEWSSHRHQAWLEMLAKIARNITICYEDSNEFPDAHATLSHIQGKFTMKINKRFYRAARALMSAAHRDTAKNMRYWFLLAVCVVHEITHAIRYLSNQPLAEPLWGNMTWAKGEAGFMWEQFMFGGRVHSISTVKSSNSGSPECTHGLSHCSWNGKCTMETEWRSIPMTVIASFFQDAAWNAGYDPAHPRPWLLPGSLGSRLESDWNRVAYGYLSNWVCLCQDCEKATIS